MKRARSALLFAGCCLALAQSASAAASLEVFRDPTIFCPSGNRGFQITFLNRSEMAQAIGSGTALKLTFPVPINAVSSMPLVTTSTYEGNTATVSFPAGYTVAGGAWFSVYITLYVQGWSPSMPLPASLSTVPNGAIVFAGAGSITTLGVADPRVCQNPAAGTPSVDDLNYSCPPYQEALTAKGNLTLSFESDPSAGTLVCRAKDGSIDLTRLQERTYQALRLMKKIPFDTPLPWTSKSLYDWFTGAVQGIRFRSDITYSFCCDPPGVINIQTNNLGVLSYTSPEWMAGFMVLFVHEARHNEGFLHTCGNDDQTIGELGSWGVQYYLNEWLAFRTGLYMTPKYCDAGCIRNWFWSDAAAVLNSRICSLLEGVFALPARLSFSNETGASKMAVFTLAKGAPHALGQIQFSGANAADFTVAGDNCSGRPIPPSCAVLTEYHPAAMGSSTALLSIVDGEGTALQAVQLSGQAHALARKTMQVNSGAAAWAATLNGSGSTQAGYASMTIPSGAAPYGLAVFSFRQDGVVVSEAGVPATSPTTSARLFIDYRSAADAIPGRPESGTIDVNTGIAVVNCGGAAANVTYTLLDSLGSPLAQGHGTMPAASHFAKFIHQLGDVAPDFVLPPDFQTAVRFGSLEIAGTQPLAVLALRQTTNQRKDTLFTTTPTADLAQSLAADPIYFPQLADGGGFTTTLILLNTSDTLESGTLFLLDNDGLPLTLSPAGGAPGSSFAYSIEPGGLFRFETDGSPESTLAGWVRVTPDSGKSTPVGAGVFSYNSGNVLVSESGIPAAAPTTHARIYVDMSGGHGTGLAIANVADAEATIALNAYYSDGLTATGTRKDPLRLAAGGHSAKFAAEFISGLPPGFTGVLDISSASPFAALTLRSLSNERGDFLMTTFPVADVERRPSIPAMFPQIADGGGYVTQFILLSASGASTTALNFYDEKGGSVAIGK